MEHPFHLQHLLKYLDHAVAAMGVQNKEQPFIQILSPLITVQPSFLTPEQLHLAESFKALWPDQEVKVKVK